MSTSVLISNLALSIDSSMLEHMFSLVGNVRTAVIQTDAASGLSRGFGVVEMSTSEEALDCVLHFNGQKRDGQTLVVRTETSPARKRSASEAVTRKPVFKKAIRAVSRQLNGDSK